jgi:hypothetical protein
MIAAILTAGLVLGLTAAALLHCLTASYHAIHEIFPEQED